MGYVIDNSCEVCTTESVAISFILGIASINSYEVQKILNETPSLFSIAKSDFKTSYVLEPYYDIIKKGQHTCQPFLINRL